MLALSGSTSPSSLIGFEEPENGIHPKRIELIAETLRARGRSGTTQFIVTTHSPVLCDWVDPSSLLMVRRGQLGTEIAPLDTWGPLGMHADVSDALEAEHMNDMTVSDRILRGDFDA
mgnify:CR=1 FL=1